MFASVEISSLVIINYMYYIIDNVLQNSHLSSDLFIVLFEMELLMLSYRN